MDQNTKDAARYVVHTKNITQQVSRFIRMTTDLYHQAVD